MKKTSIILTTLILLTGCGTNINSKQKPPVANYDTAITNIADVNETLESESKLMNHKAENGYDPSISELKYSIKTVFGGYEQLASSIDNLSDETIDYMIQAATLLQTSSDEEAAKLGDNTVNFIDVLYNSESDEVKSKAVESIYNSLVFFKGVVGIEPTVPEMFGASK